MTPFELLTILHQRQVVLWAEEGQLRFRAPQGALTPDLRAEVVAHKMELLALLQRQTPTDSAGPVPIGREGSLPLSFAQQRLWFLEQLEPGSALYNIPAYMRVTGPLEVERLRESLLAVVQRHEALRTTYTTVEDEPVQEIHTKLEPEFRFLDLSALPESEQERLVQAHARAEATESFDLVRGPLLRLMVLRLNDEEYVMLTTMHHSISDGWSVQLFYNELVTLYEASREGRPGALPTLPLQYADFATWQRQWMSGERLEAELAYWRAQLADYLGTLDLWMAQPRPAIKRFEGAHHPIRISSALTEQLRELGAQEGATLFMTVLGAFQLLLLRHSGQSDLAIGTPITNRPYVETESLIGLFVNTLVMRVKLAELSSFRALLQEVRRVALEGYAHQTLPFEKLVEALHVERDISRSPLFQVMFAWQSAALPLVELSGLRFRPLEFETHTAKFDLTLSLGEEVRGLKGYIEYNTALFDAATIARLEAHFQTLLAGVVATPDLPLSALPMLPPAERESVLHGWNQTARPYPAGQLAHRHFEAQVARTPEAIAAICRGQQLTFHELNQRANQLAHHLQRLGIGPEKTVGLAVLRSLEMVVGLLGILKAGGAYVPLDPSYPVERLAFICDNAQVMLCLTLAEWAPTLSAALPPILCLDHDWTTIAAEPTEAPPVGEHEAQLAYILYTSGSTGRPKGVMVEHRQLVNYTQAVIERCRLEAGMSHGLLQPLTVDSSVTVLWGSLVTGGCLHLIPKEEALDVAEMRAYIARHPIDVLKIAPSHLAALPGVLPRRRLIVGGESSDWRWLRSLQAAMPGGTLFNHYGPTETTVGVTTFEVRPDTTQSYRATPLGSPLANTRLYVLDAHGEPAPIGVPGELFVGGANVTRGYIGRPDLTAAAFVPDPFGGEAGARLYRTGDLARYFSDGTVEFLGRMDDQVKIRGFRIELGEVESVVRQHPGVAQALLLAREVVPGDKQLLAYVVPAPDVTWDEEALRAFLKVHLPVEMIPSFFVPLAELPRSAHGKVDRNQLPLPELRAAALSEDYVAPRTPEEVQLAALWGDVLHRDAISATANFFDLGGHSLLATQLIARIRSTFQVELPLRALFEVPTVAGLAKRVAQARVRVSGDSPPPPRAAPRDGPLPLSFAQQRMWLITQLEAALPLYNVAVALRLRGHFDAEALHHALTLIVSRHEVLRTLFPVVAGEPVQQIRPDLRLEVPLTDLGHLPAPERDAEMMRHANEEAWRPFDLAQGPLLRLSLLRLAESDHLLMISMHHIVSDRWSRELFVREWMEAYTAFVEKRPAYLPDLPLQYADFATWQRQHFKGAYLDHLLDYWTAQLAGAPPRLELPTDHPRPAVQSYQGASVVFRLPPALCTELRSLAQAEQATLYMLLLAGFHLLLHRYTGQSDISIGTPIANRTHAEVEGLIGCFVNTLVMRVQLGGNPRFREFLQRVRRVALEGYAHQDAPFEKLVEALAPERTTSQHPLFQVMLSFQNVPFKYELYLPRVTVEVLDLDASIAKRDLTMRIEELESEMMGLLEYNTALFGAATIEAMARHFEILLEQIVREPDARLSTLGARIATEKEDKIMESKKRGESSRDKFKAMLGKKPKAVTVSASELIRQEYLFGEGTLPLVVTAQFPDVDLVAWVQDNRDFIEEKLLGCGGILFRHFHLASPAHFEQVARALSTNLLDYSERSTPRHEVDGKVYTSTEYPNDQHIMLHNEMSYSHQWPKKIWFYCAQPAQVGGETPIADSREVWKRLDPSIREAFVARGGVMYVRNYGATLDLPWQNVFQTEERDQVEAYCREAGIEWEWKPGNGLRTRQRRQAILDHPQTGERVWFNAAHMFHIAGLEPEVRQSLLNLFDEADLPRNAYYGDGTRIEDEVIHAIRGTYQQVARLFPWEKGDVMLLDNILSAHGRTPYQGPRQVLVAMAEESRREGEE